MSAAGGGAIVNLSSGAATLGSPGEYVHYAGAKAAVDAITIGLSKELGPDGIRVNAVAPGAIWTEIHEDPERPARIGAQTPLGRAGEPEEVAAAVAWLLSQPTRPTRPARSFASRAGASLVSIGRSGSRLHCDHEPGKGRPAPSPACSIASRLWQAVTPEPQ